MERAGLHELVQRFSSSATDSPASAPDSTPEERHRRVVLAQIEAIAHGDFDGFAAHLTPDAVMELHAPDALPFIHHAHGREAVKTAVQQNFAAIGNQQPGPISLVGEGEDLILVGSETGTVIETGMNYECHFSIHYRFEGDLIGSIREIIAFSK